MLFLLPDELKISGMKISLFFQFTVRSHSLRNSQPKFGVSHIHCMSSPANQNQIRISDLLSVNKIAGCFTGWYNNFVRVHAWWHLQCNKTRKLEYFHVWHSLNERVKVQKRSSGEGANLNGFMILKKCENLIQNLKKLNYEACRLLQRPIDVPRLKLLESVSTLIASYPAGRI